MTFSRWTFRQMISQLRRLAMHVMHQLHAANAMAGVLRDQLSMWRRGRSCDKPCPVMQPVMVKPARVDTFTRSRQGLREGRLL